MIQNQKLFWFIGFLSDQTFAFLTYLTKYGFFNKIIQILTNIPLSDTILALRSQSSFNFLAFALCSTFFCRQVSATHNCLPSKTKKLKSMIRLYGIRTVILLVKLCYTILNHNMSYHSIKHIIYWSSFNYSCFRFWYWNGNS